MGNPGEMNRTPVVLETGTNQKRELVGYYVGFDSHSYLDWHTGRPSEEKLGMSGFHLTDVLTLISEGLKENHSFPVGNVTDIDSWIKTEEGWGFHTKYVRDVNNNIDMGSVEFFIITSTPERRVFMVQFEPDGSKITEFVPSEK